MNNSIKRLKEKLIGKEFKEKDYNKELNNLVKEFHLEANTCDFDFDRLYHIGYENKKTGMMNMFVVYRLIIFLYMTKKDIMITTL